MSKSVREDIDQLLDQQQELLEVQKDVSDTKADIAVLAMVELLKEVKTYLGDLSEIQFKAHQSKEGLSDKRAEIIATAIQKISEIQAKIEFNPQIRVDIAPIASMIAKQNDVLQKQNADILSLMQLMANTPEAKKDEGLYQLVVHMVEKQTLFIEKGFNPVDYSKELAQIAQSIPKRVTEWDMVGTREANGQIKITATAKKFE